MKPEPSGYVSVVFFGVIWGLYGDNGKNGNYYIAVIRGNEGVMRNDGLRFGLGFRVEAFRV